MRTRIAVSASVALLTVACSGAPSRHAPAARHRLGPPPAHGPIDVSSLRGRVAFSNGTDDVWVMRANGSGLRRVTASPAMDFDPSWSPDGRRLAYRHQTGDDRTTEIYVTDVTGSDARRITRNDVADWGPDWSPRGDEIVFNSSTGHSGYGFHASVIRPDGTGLRPVLARVYVEYPAWSPDGSRIAFMSQQPGASGNDPNYDIFVMDADGKHVRRLTDAPGEDGFPAWSPDGTEIAFSSTRDDCTHRPGPRCLSTGDVGPYQDIWIMDADGSRQHRLSDRLGQFAVWSPHGDAILFSPGLHVIRPDGSGLTTIPAPGVSGEPEFPDWIA